MVGKALVAGSRHLTALVNCHIDIYHVSVIFCVNTYDYS